MSKLRIREVFLKFLICQILIENLEWAHVVHKPNHKCDQNVGTSGNSVGHLISDKRNLDFCHWNRNSRNMLVRLVPLSPVMRTKIEGISTVVIQRF